VGHGYLHLDPDALARDEIEWREFGALEEAEAGRRLDAVMVWQEQVLGSRPPTFVAPAWAYSEGTRRAARARGLPAWLPPRLGPLTDGGDPRQSLDSALRTMDGLSYQPFADLAGLGVPPTPVLHGGLFDLRVEQLRSSRDVRSFARLVLRRDLLRIPAVGGLRWIGAGALVQLLRAHETVTVRGHEVDAGEAQHARLRRPDATVRPLSPS
jgi:hypothetical protein